MTQSNEGRWDRWFGRGSQFATIVAAVAAVVGAYVAYQQLPRIAEIGGLLVGDCAPGVEVQAGELCQISVGERKERFRVYDFGAHPPSQLEAQNQAVKVDWDAYGITFQAAKVGGSNDIWRVEVSGPWQKIGEGERYLCQIGDELRPGQLCVESHTGAQFRVYATDQLYPGDSRPFFPNGYAVLFYKAGEIAAGDAPARLNDRKVTHDAFAAERIQGTKSWRITSVAQSVE